MDLRELLGEELYNQVVAKLGDKHKVAVVSDGNWIPKETFNQVNEAKKQLDTDLKERDKQLADLKKNVGDNKALQDQIEKLQEDNKTKDEEYKTKLNDLAVSSAVKLALAGEVHDPEMVLGILDKTKIKVADDGKVEGLDDQVKALQSSKAFLFVEKDDDGKGRFKGIKPGESKDKGSAGQKNPWKKETLNYTEQGRILKEDPELAKQLKAAAAV
jgi:hypothetical protein